MTVPERYFDHHSTRPLSDAARRAFEEALDRFGDPLKLNERGRVARRALDEDREEIAEALGVQPDEVVFTSGGTESVALAVLGVPGSATAGRVIVPAVEHPAVLGSAALLAGRGLEVVQVPVDEHGRLDVDLFADEVRRPGTLLASVQHANHEVGTMQPAAEAATLAREAGVPFHTDARQTVGRLPVDAGGLGVDLLSLSAHAFGGPSGVGVLTIRRGIRLLPVLAGDDRERRRRAGSQNLAAIHAAAAALRESLAGIADTAAESWSLTTRLRTGIERSVPGARLHGHPTQRTPHLVCFSIPDIDAEVLLMALDQRGFRLDAGSVASGSPHEPSPVLAAMDVPDTVGIRASVGPGTTEDDVDALTSALAELVDALSRMRT
jgi:cysteine desulfurase